MTKIENYSNNFCYVWTRVSSREQQEGYSLRAQQDIIQKYLSENNLVVVRTFVIQESARQSEERKKFKEMFGQLKADKKCFILVVHKTDRLARDIRDSSAIKDWLESDERNQLHTVHERMIISKNSPSYHKFIFNINSTLANLYTDNLSEEVKKGMLAKARSGEYPGRVPRGYKNVQSTDNKRSKRWIEVDEVEAPYIKKIFELYCTGMHSLDDLSRKLFEDGMKTRDRYKGEKVFEGGKKLSKETIRKMLMDMFYTGNYFWKSQLYKGVHTPLITQTIFDKAQEMLNHRTNGSRGKKRDFLFKGLIRCGECGRMVCAEFQKPTYTNYRCTLHKKNESDPNCTQRHYTPEWFIEEQIVKAFGGFTMPGEMLESLKMELIGKHKEEIKYHEQIAARSKTEINNLQTKLYRLNDMRINKEMDAEEYQKHKEKLKAEIMSQEDVVRTHTSFDKEKFVQAVQNLDIAKNPKTLWFRFNTEEKHKLMNYLFSNLLLRDRILLIQWKNPFDLLLKYKEDQNSSEILNEARTFFEKNF